MVYTWTHGTDNTNGINLNSWYRIGTPESHTYKCCLKPEVEEFNNTHDKGKALLLTTYH